MGTGRPSHWDGWQERLLDLQSIPKPTERSYIPCARLFDAAMNVHLAKPFIDDKGKALCQAMKTNFARIRKEMPIGLADWQAYDLLKFARESILSDYDIPGQNRIFQEVTAKANRRNNSTELLVVTSPQWFFLAVTLGANNPSLTPVKQFMESKWGCEFSSQDINFHSLPAERYEELFPDMKTADENTEWTREKALCVDSDPETSDEEATDQVRLDEVLGDIRHDMANLEEKVNDVMDIIESLAADISEIKKSTDRVPVLEKSIAELVTFLHTVHGTGNRANNDDGNTSAGGPADASNGKRQRTE
ncbi:hypothetical protein FMUND_9362 [Fusarium mundagurra]|uniref:Uncharacterized protein n=1 Tax=Fusarium mundagurra TaxID=1567541 RepID=A0A8H5YDR6_9HYPO|nr:hypothetical protein FMUND_9362 [Fusarium mundagurra]